MQIVDFEFAGNLGNFIHSQEGLLSLTTQRAACET